jgi:ElaB/YqjD/DUF883 family membrane-anchored ribosome-binding protein
MATRSTESLSELERRSEQTRAELAQTVDALHSRVSPSAIKADVKSYVRDNPLQAAAIAVGAAYPVWRLVGAMPAPVLLIGAGLAMARRGGATSSHGSSMRAGGASAGGVVADLKDKAADLTGRISDTAQDTIDSLRDKVADTTHRTAEALSSTYDSTRQAAADTMQQVSERASETYARATGSLADVIERHPLLVGGVAFAVGSLVASAVPVTRQESRIMGETAEEVRRRSQDLAMQGLRQASDVAQQVYETASEDIRSGGLTPEAARRTARSAVDTARAAMENTITGGVNRT